MSTETNRNDWSTIKRLLGYFKGETKLIVLTIISLSFYAIAQAIGPTLIARAVDDNISTGDLPGLRNTMILLIGVYLISLVMMRLQLKYLGTLGQKILLKIRGQIFEKMQLLPLSFYHVNEPGDLMSRLINDTDSIGTLFSQRIIQTLSSFVSLIAIMIAMFALNVKLSLVACAVIPLMLGLSLYFARKSRKAFAKSRETLGNLSSNLEENLRMVRESQAFVRQGLNITDFDVDNAQNRDAQVEAVRITAIFAPTIDILSTLALISVIGYGSYLAFHDEVTVGVVVAFLTYSQRFYRPVQMMASFYTQLQSTLAASDRVFDVMDETPENTLGTMDITMPEIRGDVKFENVYFGYSEDQEVLKNMNFHAKPGETVAFIGETGVGKSTTINLIPRYYEVNQGKITVDGQELNEVTLSSLRSQMSEVPQSSFLFAETIADNISYGDYHPDLDKIKESATIAQCHEFIMKLPDGYDTKIGAEGTNISQGQRQLLCIARAVYADPKILLLDEATSSIDTQTEKIVQKAISKVLENRTAFVIAHRLSTISQVDTIITLGTDGVLEVGSPEELKQTNGYYATMLSRQT